MASCSTYITNRNFSLSFTLRIHVLHCSYVMERKSCFHNGTVTIDSDKNRLVRILSSGDKPPEQIKKDSVSISNTTITSKEHNMYLQVNCACTMARSEPLTHCCPQNGVILHFADLNLARTSTLANL